MDIMDIQAVESKLSDVTVTPIPRSQVQNFYNYQQQREQREQQPQIQISAIHHHVPRDRDRSVHNSHITDRSYSHSSVSSGRERDLYTKRRIDDSSGSSVAAAAVVAATAIQYTQQLQAQLALLQQQSNTTASPAVCRINSMTSSSIGGVGATVSISSGNNNVHSLLKYPQSTSPLIVTAQTSANMATQMTSSPNLTSMGGAVPSASIGLTKYAQLLGVIEELGRDIRPTYTGSRSSTERLKRGLVHARILVRECLMETERSARQ